MLASGLAGASARLTLSENRGEELHAIERILSCRPSVEQLWQAISDPATRRLTDTRPLMKHILVKLELPR
ncbi:hypothetical protein M501DRAFT_1003263 [Patellaria atrata CBS 101060]|uniref:Uncharacterized protein n=1 Tax=Patellaria atrata CBS 101060 TaxID=1346257 RepID=A0A9P4SCD6_9PEZI|nr:hypothetical protein M501DRAFT_1003263 [Patellaria atrata CBS 101060]